MGSAFGRTDLTEEQKVYAQPQERVSGMAATSNGQIGLAGLIGRIDATVLIGLSTATGAFTETIVREMAAQNAAVRSSFRFPTDCQIRGRAAILIRWTEDARSVATGFPVCARELCGRSIPIAQCKQCYIFPAIGLALAASGARRVTDGMILAAAKALAEKSPALQDTARRCSLH